MKYYNTYLSIAAQVIHVYLHSAHGCFVILLWHWSMFIPYTCVGGKTGKHYLFLHELFKLWYSILASIIWGPCSTMFVLFSKAGPISTLGPASDIDSIKWSCDWGETEVVLSITELETNFEMFTKHCLAWFVQRLTWISVPSTDLSGKWNDASTVPIENETSFVPYCAPGRRQPVYSWLRTVGQQGR